MGKVTEEEQAAAREKEKRDRFVRVVPFRCRKVLKAIAAVGKCGNRSQYSYTDEEIDEIFGKIDEAVDEAKAAFIGEKPKETVSFSFE